MADEPNKLQGSTILLLSASPLLGALILETDEGPVHMAVNRAVAEMLLEDLREFLKQEAENDN